MQYFPFIANKRGQGLSVNQAKKIISNKKHILVALCHKKANTILMHHLLIVSLSVSSGGDHYIFNQSFILLTKKFGLAQ